VSDRTTGLQGWRMVADAGQLYKPKANPLYNDSNYQATVSLPGWNR